MIEASPTAQRLVLAYRHFGKDPYELYNEGLRRHFCPECSVLRTNAVDADAIFCEGTPDAPHRPVAWQLSELPPHPRPRMYRAFLLAASGWVERNSGEGLSLRLLAGA